MLFLVGIPSRWELEIPGFRGREEIGELERRGEVTFGHCRVFGDVFLWE